MSLHRDGTLDASDGLRLYHQAWLPDGEPVGVVLVVHGLGEHSGRYVHVAEALVAAGFAVHAFDHRGHGRSEGERTFVRSYDELLGDMVTVREAVEAEHPDRPLFVLGHSMGGNIVMGHVLDHQAGLAGMVLSGPALEVGDDLSTIELRVFRLVARIAPKFRPRALSAEAISRDPAVVAAYRDDPLVYTGRITAGLGAALIDAMGRFPARYHELRLPILLLHGTDDQLANIDGTRALEAAAVHADVTAHYYEGLYHEVFNEPERERVLGDLVAWLRANLP
jgi:lysophospholipase